MPDYPEFSVAFEIACTDEDRRQAFWLYEKAFGAKKISEFSPPGSERENLHIMMEIKGMPILLHPCREKRMGGAVGCQVHFDDVNDLKGAYEALRAEGENASMSSWPHAPVSALVTDKYGVAWWLHT